jgi:hypothetical protein
LSLKTTIAALIAALSVIATASVAGAFIPQAFAQENDDDNGGTTVTAFQSNSLNKTVDQNINQFGSASTGGNDDDDTAATGTDGTDDNGGTAIVAQEASQGFCEQSNQQNAAAGNDASNSAGNGIFGSASGDVSENEGVDCS